MNKPGSKARNLDLRQFVLFASVILLALFLVVVGWFLSRNIEGELTVGVDERSGEDSRENSESSTTIPPALLIGEKLASSASTDPSLFTPAQTILNVECRMRAGKGPARDIAVVMLATEDGSAFAVLDHTGTITSGSLDFVPNHIRIGRQHNGSVVFGFGALRLNSGVFREPDTDEPIRIFHGDHLMYKTNKAWEFGVADNGSSFFVHEPAPGGTSRLVVRNLDQGTQVEFDLDTRLTPVNAYFSGYGVNYSLDGSEIVFHSAQEDSMGKGVYYFYPIGEGRPRRIKVEGSWGALLTSSENGYFVDRPDDLKPGEFGDVWQVTRRRIDVANDETQDIWSKRLPIRNHGGHLSISQNGKWLGMSGYDYKVLDTETGETIFSYPSAGNPEAKLARLSPVLPLGATIADMGTESYMGFRGNTLVAYRQYGDTEACSRKPGEPWDAVKWRECIKRLRLRGMSREFYDIYEMDSIQLDSSPSYTVEVYSESNCMPAQKRWRGLLDLDGELAYRSEQKFEAKFSK